MLNFSFYLRFPFFKETETKNLNIFIIPWQILELKKIQKFTSHKQKSKIIKVT